MSLPSGAELIAFFDTPWSIAWVALLIILIYGWHHMREVYPTASPSSRRFSQGDASTNSQSLRMIARVLYASGGMMLLLASPFLVTRALSGQLDPTVAGMLSLLGLADLIAGIVLLRTAKEREHMAGPVLQ